MKNLKKAEIKLQKLLEEREKNNQKYIHAIIDYSNAFRDYTMYLIGRHTERLERLQQLNN